MNDIMNNRVLRHFNAGSVIFKENDPGSSMYIISSGKVEVTTYKNNQKLVLATLSTGSIFGEMALIDQPYRSATVSAITDVNCIEINQLLFNANIQKIPGWLKSFFQILVERLRECNKKLDTYGAAEKSKQIVLMLNELLNNPEYRDVLIPKLNWSVTVNKLEVLLNIPAQFLNKVMYNLTQTPLAEQETDFQQGRLLVINDPEQFHQFSDFCQSDLKSRIHQDKSEDSDHLTDTAKKFLNFIEKLISEQGGGTDLEIHFLESRCKELLGVPLDQYKDTTNQLVNQKIISARRTPDGDFYYDVDKRRIRELTDGEQQHDFFRKWEQLIGRE